MPVGPAKFDVNRCNESPLRGEKPDFWLVGKFNTGSLPLRGIVPVKIFIKRLIQKERKEHLQVLTLKIPSRWLSLELCEASMTPNALKIHGTPSRTNMVYAPHSRVQ